MPRLFNSRTFCGALVVAAMVLASPAGAVVCIIGPAGDLPPVCLPGGTNGYLSPNDVHMIIDGLPPGSTITLGAEHARFSNQTVTPDGAGGATENFNSILTLHLTTHGENLPPLTHNIQLQTQDQTHTGPRNPSAAFQSFDTEMLSIQGAIGPADNDPLFSSLQITAGSLHGMPSPGHTTLTRLPNGNFSVDSFFDIEYRIDFIGRPGGPLAGMAGSTPGTIRMQAGESFVPEPASLCLLGLGVVGMLGLARRRRVA